MKNNKQVILNYKDRAVLSFRRSIKIYFLYFPMNEMFISIICCVKLTYICFFLLKVHSFESTCRVSGME